MANPTSGTPADVMAGTPPLSASEVEPTKARTFGMRSDTSEAFVEAFCWSSSTSSDSLRPQIPPSALIAENSASTPWLPWGNDPVNGPVSPLTLPKVMEVGETPVSDAVLPAVPVQSPASAAGEKLKPADVVETVEAGADVAPPAAAPPAGEPPAVPAAAVLTPELIDEPGPEIVDADPATLATEVVVTPPTPAACCGAELPPEPAPR